MRSKGTQGSVCIDAICHSPRDRLATSSCLQRALRGVRKGSWLNSIDSSGQMEGYKTRRADPHVSDPCKALPHLWESVCQSAGGIALLLLSAAEWDPRVCWRLPLLWCDLERGWQAQGALCPLQQEPTSQALGLLGSCGLQPHTHLLWPPENGMGQL